MKREAFFISIKEDYLCRAEIFTLGDVRYDDDDNMMFPWRKIKLQQIMFFFLHISRCEFKFCSNAQTMIRVFCNVRIPLGVSAQVDFTCTQFASHCEQFHSTCAKNALNEQLCLTALRLES